MILHTLTSFRMRPPQLRHPPWGRVSEMNGSIKAQRSEQVHRSRLTVMMHDMNGRLVQDLSSLRHYFVSNPLGSLHDLTVRTSGSGTRTLHPPSSSSVLFGVGLLEVF